MIADCETCDRKQVPCTACEVSQRAICFVCQGDEADPYGEAAADRLSGAVDLLREGLRGMAVDERMRWKVRVEAFLGRTREGIALSHDDLCILSRIYNDRDAPVSLDASIRINEWLKVRIAATTTARSSAEGVG